jgi:hypothetical protein
VLLVVNFRTGELNSRMKQNKDQETRVSILMRQTFLGELYAVTYAGNIENVGAVPIN